MLIAIDTKNAKDTAYFDIEVINTNDAPVVINNIPDMETQTEALYEYQIPDNIFNDIDFGDMLSYSAKLSDGSILPMWLDFNKDSKTLSGIPEEAEIINIEIIATDIAGESASDIFTLTINQATEVTTLPDMKIDIYPNPTKDIIYVTIPEEFVENNCIISITDINGKKIVERLIISNITEFDLTNYASGSYVIELCSDNEQIKKIIVKD